MSYYGYPPPPWFGPPPTPTTLAQTIEEYQKGLEALKDYEKKKKDEESRKKPKSAFEGLTKRDIFWVMTLLSPVVGWGVLNVFIMCLQNMAALLQQPILK